jgi:hypothetical protein
MSSASNIASALLGVAGGATVGAYITGAFTYRIKRKKRVQRRRESVYIDMLTWIHARTVVVQAKAASNGNGAGSGRELADTDAGSDPGGDDLVASPSAAEPKVSFPDSHATEPHAKTDPGTQYFVTLRARIIAFGSHDMARAFDRWTVAYLKVTKGPANGLWSGNIKNADAILVPDPPSPAEAPAISRRAGRKQFSKFNGKRKWRLLLDPGLPIPEAGGLTKAIERCASKELRKG